MSVDDRARPLRRVLERVAATRLERLVGHPADHRVEVLADHRGLFGLAIRSPRPTSMSSARWIVTLIGANAASIGRPPSSIARSWCGRRRQDHDLVAGAQHAAGDLAGVAAVVVVRVGLRADDPLHREAHVDQVAIAAMRHVLEVLQQRRAGVPGHLGAALDDVGAGQRAQRDERMS